jgi:hypothetical protein
MRKLPRGKSGGPDEMTYEMWQVAPDPMRELLWRSVNSVLAGSPLPEEWTGAFTKLIVKKAGAEGHLEDLRPVCLMSTAANIITGIWAHRLSTTLEARGVLEDVQEGFRPERSTKRQVMRLLNCINDAKRNGKQLVVAFLDFENYFNAIGLEAVRLLLLLLLTRFTSSVSMYHPEPDLRRYWRMRDWHGWWLFSMGLRRRISLHARS